MNLESLNESQKKAVTYEGKHLLVLAGAGTGKTKTIISRAAYLISKGTSPSKIQILTFTKRSASEIVSRVRASLTTNEAKTLNGSTFHSWCNQLLTKYPNLFGTKSYTVIDSDDQVSIMKIVCGNKSLAYEDIKVKPQGLIGPRGTTRPASPTTSAQPSALVVTMAQPASIASSSTIGKFSWIDGNTRIGDDSYRDRKVSQSTKPTNRTFGATLRACASSWSLKGPSPAMTNSHSLSTPATGCADRSRDRGAAGVHSARSQPEPSSPAAASTQQGTATARSPPRRPRRSGARRA